LKAPFHDAGNYHANRDHPRMLVKKRNESSEHVSTVDFFSNRQMRTYIGIIVCFISDEKPYKSMLVCRWSNGHHTAENIVTRSLEK